jgi:DNA gyrase subunit A
MITVGEYKDDEYLLMVTKYGVVKRTKLSEYEYQRKGGKIALNLDDGDELVYVRHTTGSDEIIIATKGGNAVRFREEDARVMGRTARGVRGIKLEEGDFVTGVALVDDNCKLLTITEKGFGKRSPFDDFKTKNRGGKGVTVHGLSDKTGALAAILTVGDEDDIVAVTSDGVTIRTHVSDISVYSRTAGGVILMRLDEGCKINNVARLEKSEDIEKQSAEAEANIEKTPIEEEKEVLESEE